MSETITVASRVHTSIRVGDIVIKGGNSLDAVDGIGLTFGVDAATFREWYAAQTAHMTQLVDLVCEWVGVEADDEAAPVDPAPVEVVQPDPEPIAEATPAPVEEAPVEAEPAAPVE